jgi:hypothetical protein
MVWPDGSWTFSKLLGDEFTRLLTTVLLVLVAVAFIAGGIGLFAKQTWWRPVTVGVALFSSTIFLLFWDGKFQALPDKGGVGILINLAILFFASVSKWPA